MATHALTRPPIDCNDAFAIDEIDAINTSIETRGFAMVRDVLSDSLVEVLKKATWDAAQVDEIPEKGARTVINFVEVSEPAIELLRYEPYITLSEKLYGSSDLVIHRSACIARRPGSSPMRWHTDHSFATDDNLQTCNDVLNRSTTHAGFWFYLTGSRPSHGGLCVIEGSHVPDWEPPAGYRFADGGRKQLVRADGSPIEPKNDDIPGCVRLIAGPRDMLIFAARTFHAPLENNEDEVRLSCAIGFRDRSIRIDPPWDMTEDCRRFLERAPADIQRFLPGYTSIDRSWRGNAVATA